jgi:putative transposase
LLQTVLTLSLQSAMMARYLRPKVTGPQIFFTLALEQRGEDRLLRHIDDLRDAVRMTQNSRPFRIDAMVVLPDHLHAIWTLPPQDRDFATRWGSIKALFSMRQEAGAQRASHLKRREKAIWQRRFWEHHIRDECDLAAHMGYCWANPVKHGLVARAVDWPFSSIHREIKRGKVDPSWSGIVPSGDYGE